MIKNHSTGSRTNPTPPVLNQFVDGVVFTTVFFGYGWLFFKGGMSEFFDEFAALLPHPWGWWNSVAIAIGIGVWIAHRAITGRNWFADFNDGSAHAEQPSIQAYIKGSALFLAVVNGTTLMFWLVGN